MSTKSNDQGRAYEYAWLKTLYENLYMSRKTRIIENSSFYANERAWASITSDVQNSMLASAKTAIKTILELEPKLLEDDTDELIMQFQNDGYGIVGDVRDIVIQRNDIMWEIGLSIKHNHDAVKHSRLSYKIDFGKEWYNLPCSEEYWNTVKPIFSFLKNEKEKGTKWSELEDKKQKVYKPLLQAFIDEVNKACEFDKMVPRKMIEYLIGVRDYYKIVSKDNKRITLIHTFNMHGTLNKSSKTKTPVIEVPVIKMPTRMIALEFKPNSYNTVEMYLDNGWQLSFRIHSAKSTVEPSLKFDIQFISMPVSVYNIECKWEVD